jgi:hypothetical protein
MKPHRGINSANVAGEGLADLPGLLIAIAFLFFPLSFLLPRYIQRAYSGWILGLFLSVEIIAAILYLLAARRNRKDSEQLQNMLHQMNVQQRH